MPWDRHCDARCIPGLPAHVVQRFEDAVANSVLRNVSKPSFDHVQPGTAGRGKVNVKSLVPLQPVDDFGVFVSGIVIND